MDLDSKIQKMKSDLEKDDIKYPVTEFDPEGIFVDASLFPDGLTKTKFEQIKEKGVQRDMKKIQGRREVEPRNKEFTSRLRDENDKFQELQTKQKMTERNKLDASQTPREPEPEPVNEVDISTYKCVALKEVTNYLWKNKDKKEYIEVIIDLLYSISNSEDIEEIKKLVEIYRRQTGRGKKKKKLSKKRSGKRGGKRSNKKNTKKKSSK